MNIKYKHGSTEQGKEMLITEELENGTIPASMSGWTPSRRGVCGVAVFSFCLTLIILAVTGNNCMYDVYVVFI